MTFNKPVETKVAIYIRISTQSQKTDRQKEELESYAKKNNFEIVDTYTDIMSGFKDDEYRDGLQKLIEDSKLGKFDAILFSEFTRLSRKVSDLGTMIETFRKHKTNLYFQKENLWVYEKDDLSTNILISVLGLVSSYEIELFAERSISGKISAIRSRGINHGGLTAYGYESEKDTKKLIINIEEAEVIKKIFNMYANGYTQHQICDVLNSKNLPSPYRKRLTDSAKEKANNGFSQKEYKNFDTETLVWTASGLNKILKNRLYMGERKIIIHKPDPTNKIAIKKRENREVFDTINVKVDSIIKESLFNEVQLMLKKNSTVKNTPTKHPTLLKSVLKCGCCGRNFASTKANGTYTYKCFGKIKDAKTRVVKCTDSLEIAQYKLDGLVVQLIISRLANSERSQKSKERIEELTLKKKEQETVLNSKKSKLLEEDESFYRFLEKFSRSNLPDSFFEKKQNEYDTIKNKLNDEISNLKIEIYNIEKNVRSIQDMDKHETQRQNEATIRESKSLLKQLTDEYLNTVTVYPIFDKYSLVIVSFKDGSETWGTIKSAKYKNDEIWYDPTFCKEPHYIYQLWDNDDKSAEYNHENKTVIFKGKTTTTWINPNATESKPKFETITREGQNPIIRIIKPETSTDDSNSVPIISPDPYITIEPGTYPIKEFIKLLKEDNANGDNQNGDFPPYDFHEDEVGHEDSIEKAKKYRQDNADKKNVRRKELYKNRTNKRDI